MKSSKRGKKKLPRNQKFAEAKQTMGGAKISEQYNQRGKRKGPNPRPHFQKMKQRSNLCGKSKAAIGPKEIQGGK
ncbi:hypothetical protein V6N13_096820 [Hibiscus sabdariffa]|uniref:Uncharacterized protein n=1 Tax=Hibiscus sabdariffa TaxID=183260 RepID=A0ABR2C9K3_9ROSI